MGTDLTPVNSDLITLIESQLLGTELHVNDDENITMADDLLDLELDTMSLNQSTRPNTVFRVPHKKMHDSQASNSRLSSELCCKDQLRSNNNSALLATTRSLNYDDMPPLEMAWDEEPTSATLPEILLTQHSWVAKDTEALIQQNRGDDSCTTCRLCQQHFSTPRRLRVHTPQHYITTFCPCGEYSYHRIFILRHQRTMECHTGHLYGVDKHYFPTLSSLSYLISTATNGYDKNSRPPRYHARTLFQTPRIQKTRKVSPISPGTYCAPSRHYTSGCLAADRGTTETALSLSHLSTTLS